MKLPSYSTFETKEKIVYSFMKWYPQETVCHCSTSLKNSTDLSQTADNGYKY